jgi:hypothetical protein
MKVGNAQTQSYRLIGSDTINSREWKDQMARQNSGRLRGASRETIWARHNALLVPNSLIIGALAISPTALWENKWAAVAMLGAGLLIGAAWLLIPVLAWQAIKRHSEIAGTFASSSFKHLPNPSPRRSATARRPGFTT